jgi:hypothetical protein
VDDPIALLVLVIVFAVGFAVGYGVRARKSRKRRRRYAPLEQTEAAHGAKLSGLRNSSGNLATLAAIRRASFRLASTGLMIVQKERDRPPKAGPPPDARIYPLVTTGAAGGGAFPLPTY